MSGQRGGQGTPDNATALYSAVGVLECDPDADLLRCHICGDWKRNLAQHARLTHRLAADEYRRIAGLNRTTRLISPGQRAHLRELALPIICRLRGEGKLRRWDEDRQKLAECKSLAVAVIRDGMRSECRRHRSGNLSPEARARMSEQTRQRNLDGKLRASSEAISAGLRRYYREHPEAGAAAAERLKKRLNPPKDTSRDVSCCLCGQVFRAASHREAVCPPCRPAARRKYSRESKRRSRLALRAAAGQRP